MTIAAYAELPPRQRVTFVEHFVARGETLGGIAQRYRVSQAMLIAANPKVQEPESQDRPADRGSHRWRALDQGRPPDGRAGGGGGHQHRRTFHRVKRGRNDLRDRRRVWRDASESCWPGMGWTAGDASASGSALRVVVAEMRARQSCRGTAETTAAAKTHIVRRGETLKGLAKRYGVSIQALREANGLSERETLKTGIALRIPG